MSEKEARDFIFIIWQDAKSRNNYTIGTLTRKNSQYTFSYGLEVNEAKKQGFLPLVSFPNFERTYRSTTMFPAFSCRLPDPKRRDIETILHKYGLTHYDEFELLKKSGARLPTDTLSFIDPIFDDETYINRIFCVMGTRHYMACTGDNCECICQLVSGTQLVLQTEPSNLHDKHAVQVLTQDGNLLGYVPRYYSEAITKRLSLNSSYICEVAEHNRQKPCGECLKVQLQMPAL